MWGEQVAEARFSLLGLAICWNARRFCRNTVAFGEEDDGNKT